MTTDWTIHLLDVVTAVGIIVTIYSFLMAYLYGKRKDQQTANHQNYQRLELASIQVFQNEIDHPELAQIWEKNRKEVRSEQLPLHLYDAFLYQHTNLFEMAYSFCADGDLEAEIFGSWVLWFANLCRSPYFRDFWTKTEAPQNYIHGFRDIMNEGCKLYDGQVYHPENRTQVLHEKHRQFFRYVAKQIKSPELEKWLDQI